MRQAIVGVLIFLNAVVLLGQLWPAGAPPFARGVNIAFLVGSLAFFVSVLLREMTASRPRDKAGEGDS